MHIFVLCDSPRRPRTRFRRSSHFYKPRTGRDRYGVCRHKGLGLPPKATPETVAATAHIGELYFVAPDKLVTVNGTIVAPFTPPANGQPESFPSWIAGMKLATDIVEQVEAFRRKTPEADGRRITVEKGQHYVVVRSDGKAFVMQIGDVDRNGISPSLLYLGRGCGREEPRPQIEPAAKSEGKSQVGCVQITARMRPRPLAIGHEARASPQLKNWFPPARELSGGARRDTTAGLAHDRTPPAATSHTRVEYDQ